MDELRPDALATVAARVVAWHNRHPLARRITADQVQSVGYVVLPFSAPPGSTQPAEVPADVPAESEADKGKSLRERALARARQQETAAAAIAPAASAAAPADGPAARGKAEGRSRAEASLWKGLFTEDFIPPLQPRRIARWAARHGRTAARAPTNGPLRVVEADTTLASDATARQTLYLLTAMVEHQGRRVRMLLAPHEQGPLLGSRLWGAPRVAGAAAAACTALGLAGSLAWEWSAVPQDTHTAPMSSASAARAVASAPPASAAASAPVTLAAVAAGESAASAVDGVDVDPTGVASAALAASVSAAASAAQVTGPLAANHRVAAAPAIAPAGRAASQPGAAFAPTGVAGRLTPTLTTPVPSIRPSGLRAAAVAELAQATSPAASSSAPKPAAQGAAVAMAGDRPLDVEPTLGRVDLPALGLPRRERSEAEELQRRQNLRMAAAATLAVEPRRVPDRAVAAAPPSPALAKPAPPTAAAVVAPLAMPAVPNVPAVAPSAPGAATAAVAPAVAPASAAGAAVQRPAAPASAAAYALTTRRLRTRAESEQTRAAMQALLLSAGMRQVRVDVVPEGDDWRVVGMPFPKREQAERARALLAARGMRLQVIDF